jgi:hypothetical protein
VAELAQQTPPGGKPELPPPPDDWADSQPRGLFALFVAAVFAVGLGQVALRGSVPSALRLREGLAGAVRNLLPLLVMAAIAFALMMAAAITLLLVGGVLGCCTRCWRWWCSCRSTWPSCWSSTWSCSG